MSVSGSRNTQTYFLSMIVFVKLGNGSLEVIDCYSPPGGLSAIDKTCNCNARNDRCCSKLYIVISSLPLEPG